MKKAKNVIWTSNKSQKISRLELLDWVNKLLDCNLEKIDHMCTGAAYCQFMDILFPGSIIMKKVKFLTNLEYQYISNFKLLQESFHKCSVDKVVPINELVRGRFQANFEFLQWFYVFFEANYDASVLEAYDPMAARQGVALNLGKPEKTQLVAKKSKQSIYKTPPNDFLVEKPLKDFLVKKVSEQPILVVEEKPIIYMEAPVIKPILKLTRTPSPVMENVYKSETSVSRLSSAIPMATSSSNSTSKKPIRPRVKFSSKDLKLTKSKELSDKQLLLKINDVHWKVNIESKIDKKYRFQRNKYFSQLYHIVKCCGAHVEDRDEVMDTILGIVYSSDFESPLDGRIPSQ